MFVLSFKAAAVGAQSYVLNNMQLMSKALYKIYMEVKYVL